MDKSTSMLPSSLTLINSHSILREYPLYYLELPHSFLNRSKQSDNSVRDGDDSPSERGGRVGQKMQGDSMPGQVGRDMGVGVGETLRFGWFWGE